MNDKMNDPTAKPVTIGLLIDTIVGQGLYHASLWAGVADAASNGNVNVICFAGGSLASSSAADSYVNQRNIIYKLATPLTIDGLVIAGSTLANYATDEYVNNFYGYYHPLPVVNIGITRRGVPSVMINNEQGLRDLLSHLIQEHGYKRIAFVRGPEGNEDADQRYQVYTQVLNEHGISLDPQLVAQGNFLTSAGTEAISTFLDKRHVAFDVIVAANDNMAIGALDALQSRGITVPHDVAVVGFDDLEVAQATTPSLTTVRQPIYALGYEAARTLIDLIRGQDVPERALLSTELVIRQSCGCLGQVKHLPAVRQEEIKTFTDALEVHREEIITTLIQTIQDADRELGHEQAAQLVDAFEASLRQQNTQFFLQALDKNLRKTLAQNDDLTRWHEALHILHQYIFPHLQDSQTTSSIATLLLQASILIGDVAKQVQIFNRLQAEQQAEVLRHASQALIASFDVQALVDAAIQSIPLLGINRFYIALYEDPQSPTKWVQLILAHQENGPLKLKGEELRYPTLQLLPPNLLPSDRSYHLLLDSLYFQNEKLGLILFEVGPRIGIIYATLRAQISGALKGALLFQERQKAQDELERSNRELEQFAYVASHDLQEPLRMVTSYLQLLEKRYKDKLDTDAQEFIAYAVDGARRMKQRIDDLLTYSRMATRGQPLGSIDCEHLLTKVLSNLEIAIRANDALVTHDSLPTVVADGMQLLGVFQNLIENAIKFHANRRPHVHISAERTGDEWLFSVRDNGIGIAPEYAERIFAIFSRLHPQARYPGTGIGLAICKRVIERHGGRIWVESQTGEGATFFFTVPVPE